MVPKITTDGRWKTFKYAYDVPRKILQSDLDFVPDEYGFIKYKNIWYHISEFMQIPEGGNFPSNWMGYLPSTAFSGLVIEVHPEGYEYKIGWYRS
jgi:hypothetical protein